MNFYPCARRPCYLFRTNQPYVLSVCFEPSQKQFEGIVVQILAHVEKAVGIPDFIFLHGLRDLFSEISFLKKCLTEPKM